MILNTRKKERIDGTVIQLKPYPYRKGDKTTSIIVKEDINIIFNRIKNLYQQLETNEEVIIKHIK